MTENVPHKSQNSAPISSEGTWFLTGPTASGKSLVAVEIALQIGAEIISMDSMAVYRGMEIGTAKPEPRLRDRVVHHLLDLVDPAEEFSLAEYLQAAHRAAEEIRLRGRQVLFVGGTPLYLRALLRGASTGPPPDWDFRKEMQSLEARNGPGTLHAKLETVDPLSAQRLQPGDLKRIIRALEVFERTGTTISSQQVHAQDPEGPLHPRVIAIHWPRDILHERINRRVLEMFDQGLVAETQALLCRVNPPGRTARQALGYREVAEHLVGKMSLDEAIAAVQVRTRQFAKRQMTWIRSFREIQLVSPDPQDSPAQIAKRILEPLGEGLSP